MMPALAKVEYFGGPADGDKRVARELEFLSVDGRTAHRYVRGKRGMEWTGVFTGQLPLGHNLLMLVPGRDR